MPCTTQVAQNLTTASLTSLCGQPIGIANFLTPLANDLNAIRDQSFMDSGSSCSRLMTPDYFESPFVSSVLAVAPLQSNITSITIPAVPYPSRLLITGRIRDTMAATTALTASTANITLSLGNYVGLAGSSFITGARFTKDQGTATQDIEDQFISYNIPVAAGIPGTIYISGSATSTGHTIDPNIQVMRFHQ
jgi:hypothetical protein